MLVMIESKSKLNSKWRRPALVAALLFASATIAAAQTENILHVFSAGNDGYFPEIDPLVLDTSGNLYGTTTYGGGGNCMFGLNTGCGMIYQLSPPMPGNAPPAGAWTENIIWQFQGGTDGGIPGGLLWRGGKLYGAAGIGGSGSCTGGCGYLFEMVPPSTPGGSWTKTPLYDFPTLEAECGITAFDAAGSLYGVGPSSNGNGQVCKITPPHTSGGSWSEHTLYIFKGVARGQKFGDGSGPLGVTFDSQGNLWGATLNGGYCQRFEGGSCFGTIFELTHPSAAGSPWTETVVYRFSNRDQNPTSSVVIDKAGALYGITYVEAYKFSGGALTVIDSFPDTPPNGYAPTGGVILDSAGNVYGTTGAGGQFGYGTVYKLAAPTYSQTILHSFEAGTDGWNPEGPLTLGPNNSLFGTTQIGGNLGCAQYESGGIGCGTVFEIVQ
jgi:uncharacterized repeat protein (TIGR03803 family)